MKKTHLQPKAKAILKHLLSGKSLTTRSCMQLYNTHKLSNRVCEMEDELKFSCTRKRIKLKTPHGTNECYYSYSLDKKTIQYLIKKLKNK